MVVVLSLQDAVHHGPANILLILGVPVLSHSTAPVNIPLNCNVLRSTVDDDDDDSNVLPQAHKFWENAVAPFKKGKNIEQVHYHFHLLQGSVAQTKKNAYLKHTIHRGGLSDIPS